VPLLAQSTQEPELKGYVTRVASAAVIDVNGIHVRMDDKTQRYLLADKTSAPTSAQEWKPYVGQAARVYGKLLKKEGAITASEIDLRRQAEHEVSGSGVVDALLPVAPDAPPESHLLRADGYPVLVTGQTLLDFQPPVTATRAFQTNVWITFHGMQRTDGVVVASNASFRENSMDKEEEELRKKTEHDPSTVDLTARQRGLSTAFHGVDPKRIPPYNNPAMQSRVSSIGEKLVPKYQRELADTDEARINFRFQVVMEDKWREAIAWPNGVILVPRHVVWSMQNDAQLAAMLADNIACVLERQTPSTLSAMDATTAEDVAGRQISLWVQDTGLNPIPWLFRKAHNSAIDHMLPDEREQRARVSLALMNDAGYDVNEAPLAWWALADQKSSGLQRVRLPDRSVYLYKVLGETWHKE
jgi:hypothetical protein